MKEDFINKLRALFEEYEAVLTLESFYYEEGNYMEIALYKQPLTGHTFPATIYLGGEFKHDTPL